MTDALTRPAERLANIATSPIRAIFDRAAVPEADGEKIYHFEIGRPDFDSPEVTKAATVDAPRRGKVHYTANAGTAELRAAISGYLADRRDTRYRPDGEIIVTVGANQAVFLAVMAFGGPGHEVVVPVPAWAHYRACIRLAGEEAEAMRREFARRRDAALRELGRTDKIDVAPPDGPFYLYLSYHPDTAEPADELAPRLLEERRVATVPGTAFDPLGGTHSLRVCYACPIEDVTEGLRRIVNLIEMGPR